MLLSIVFVLIFSCKSAVEVETEVIVPEVPTTSIIPNNILLIIADDMGKDATPGFSEGSVKPITPTISAIKNQGVTFNNFWAYPTCSPTRASIITGKYGYRTGVKWASDVLDASEITLQHYISQHTNSAYATAIAGKWHLSGNGLGVNPEDYGLDYYAGLLGGSVQSYSQWTLTEGGQQNNNQTEYITAKITDLAIDWVNAQEKPWFLWLAYTAPHTPFHAPPAEMHSQGDLPEYTEGTDATPYYMAMIEAMDYQIARLLENIPQEEKENLTILFMGDNGTPGQVVQSPYTRVRAKGSLHQGGINTPLFVSGTGVTRVGEEDNNLINSADLFATIAKMAGVSVSEINDSKDFSNLFTQEGTHRDFQYSEMRSETEDMWTISNGEYKLMVNIDGSQTLYELLTDPYERDALDLEELTATQQTAKGVLEDALTQIRD